MYVTVSLYIVIVLISKNLSALILTQFVTRNNSDGCTTLAEKASFIFRYVCVTKKVVHAYAPKVQTLQARTQNLSTGMAGRRGGGWV